MSADSYPITKAAIYAISHDLAAPLRHVAELTRLVEDAHSDLPEDTLETLELIRLEGEKGGLMLEGMLSLEAAESVAVNIRSVELAEIDTLKETDIPPLTVKADIKLLDLTIDELISNAKYYGKYAKIQVSETPNEVAITINDGGPGIAKEKWLQALRPFVRLNDPISSDRLGLGLTRAALWCQRAGHRLETTDSGVSIALQKAA